MESLSRRWFMKAAAAVSALAFGSGATLAKPVKSFNGKVGLHRFWNDWEYRWPSRGGVPHSLEFDMASSPEALAALTSGEEVRTPKVVLTYLRSDNGQFFDADTYWIEVVADSRWPRFVDFEGKRIWVVQRDDMDIVRRLEALMQDA